MLYLWVCLYAFYFLSFRHALIQLGIIAVAYGALLIAAGIDGLQRPQRPARPSRRRRGAPQGRRAAADRDPRHRPGRQGGGRRIRRCFRAPRRTRPSRSPSACGRPSGASSPRAASSSASGSPARRRPPIRPSRPSGDGRTRRCIGRSEPGATRSGSARRRARETRPSPPSGGGGIRTPGPARPVNSFQGCRIRPLCHPSAVLYKGSGAEAVAKLGRGPALPASGDRAPSQPLRAGRGD
jgi:hypothetical protein